MPVKVRCQSCEKVFGAPDAARGKVVKCPGCEGKVKVPAGDGAKSGGSSKGPAKKPAKKSDDHDDHEHFLKNLDLDSVADDEANICPKCGQEIYDEEARECPSCGLDFQTGQTKEKQKGVDPKIFFSVVWKDSWKFMKANIPFAIRTNIYTVIFTILHIGCLLMTVYCSNWPPRMFCAGLALFTLMVPAGWVWFLNGEIIKATMEKKDSLPRINFDMYTCIALGLKFVLWNAAMGAQLVLPLVGLFLLNQGNLPAGLALLGIGELLVLLTVPQVMVHMTMPITKRGWMAHIQFQTMGKSFAACVLWCVLAFVGSLPALVPVGVLAGIKAGAVGEFAGTIIYNYKANGILGADTAVYEAKRSNPKKGETLEPINLEDPKYKTKPYPWNGMILPAIGLFLTECLVGFGAVFAMRANGLFGLYYKRFLKLESMVKEVKYVAKKKPEDETPAERAARKKKEMIANSVGVVVLLAVLAGVVWYMYFRKTDDGPPIPGADPAAAGAPADGAAAPPAGGPGGAPGAAGGPVPGMP